MRVMRAVLAALALLLAAVLAPSPAAAHLTPNSVVMLDFGSSRAAAEITVPASELAFATGLRVRRPDDPAVIGYFAERLGVRAPDGRAWTVRPRGLALAGEGWAQDIVAAFDLLPPPGASPRRFDLDYRGVIDRLPNHFVLVFARSDVASGVLSTDTQMIGALQAQQTRLHVDRGQGSAWAGFKGAIGLGMAHIAEGHDHLLFLIALLLPAPLLAAGRRWGGYGGLRHTARRLVQVVSAFTVGHSVTLIGGAFFGWKLPSQPVEVGIAVSILVSAVHAWRPLFAGREALLAGLFGLVHGLAFATIIGNFGLEPLQKAQSILGFNLGIELVQLIVVAATTPALVMLAQTRLYPPFRATGALFAGIAALAWIVERVGGVENPVGRVIDAGLGRAPWLLLALTLGAGVALLRQRRSGAGARPSVAGT